MGTNLWSEGYRADIDGLRALAIILVVLHHIFPRHLTGGFVGVDVFFVISGYLITGMILKEAALSRLNLIEFYAKRIRRIFPALFLVISFSIIFGWLILLKDEFSVLGKHVVGGVGFVANFIYWNESGYFDALSAQKPLLHLWSLAVEEQFYLFWPLVVYSALRVKRLHIVLPLLVAVSFVVSVVLCDAYPVAGYYSPFSRAWELGIGSLLMIIPKQRPTWWNDVGLLGITMILLSALCYSKYLVFPGYLAILPVVGAALVIDSGSQNSQIWFGRKILANDTFVLVGKISYPLYLWHWVLLAFLSILMCGNSLAWQRTLAGGVSVLLAWLTWHFLERNIRYRQSGQTVVYLCAWGILLIGIGGLAWSNVILVRNSDPGDEKVIRAASDWDYPPEGFIAEKKNDVEIFRGGLGERVVVFLGDSHMQQYAPRISELLKRNSEYSAVFIAQGGCPPIPIKLTRDPSHCADVLNAGMYEIAKKNVVAVVVGGFWNGYFDSGKQDMAQFSFGVADKDMSDSSQREIALNALAGMLVRFSKSHRTILVLDNPTDAMFDPRRRMTGGRLLRNNAVVNAVDSVAIASWQFELKEKMKTSALKSGAEVVDPSNYLCKGDVCRGITPSGELFYKDEHHLRASQIKKFGIWIDTVMLPVHAEL